MCGRYASSRRPEDLTVEFAAADETGDALLPADYNVAPTKPVHAVLVRDDRRRLEVLHWGLVPWWADDPAVGSRLINARAETIGERPAFRGAYERRRCLVPADGWYEWALRPDGPGRRPYFLTDPAGALLAFAGVYEEWGNGPDRLRTCAIVTTAATGPLTAVHERMPLVLERAAWQRWLDPALPDPADLLAPASSVAIRLEVRPVGPAVGDVRNNGPELTAAARPEPAAQTLF
jgi:putative SOS response-associated peptidase YedK